MEKNTLSYIDEVNTEKDSWTLKVRILRIWKQTYQMDMILMDEKVQKIHATVRKVLIPVFDNLLQEGDTIILSRFGVAANDGKYPVIKHQYKINFYRNTAVKKCQCFEGPVYGFRFVPFDDILSESVDVDMTVDVIANVVECTDMEIFDRNGREAKRISLVLEDLEGKRVGCTLWDTFAQKFSTFLADDNKDANVMIIIQFAKVRPWKGKPTVQNSMFGTKLYINDDIDELNEFKNSLLLKNRDDSSSQLPTQLSSQTVYADRHEFQMYQRKYLDELVEIKEEMVCCVFGTIKSIQEQYGWFYVACRKCNKKVVPRWEIVDLEDIDSNEAEPEKENGVLYCPKCKTKTTSMIPRYKVNVRLQDDTGTMSFVLFDNEVSKIVKKTASDVRERQVKEGDNGSVPEELSQLINKKVIFKIQVSNYNIQNRWNVYTVLKISVHPEMIALMEKAKVTIQDNDDFDSVRPEDSSQGCFDSKDALSFTADSSAPTEVDNSATSPATKRLKSTPAKDKHLQSSSTKRKLLPVKIEKP